MDRRLLAVSVIVFVGVVAACSSGPPESPPAPSAAQPARLVPVALTGPVDGVKQAVSTEQLTPRMGQSPDGPQLRDEFGENLVVLDAGRRIVVLGDPVPGPDGTWVRAWVAWTPEVYPGDFFAWLPATQKGRATIRPVDSAVCPRDATIGSLAALLPPDRFRCAGQTRITIDAQSWLAGQIPIYDTTPNWYGANADVRRSISLFDAGPTPFAPDAPTSAEAAGAGIDARVPPNVDMPPSGMSLRVTGQFGDPSADGCTRIQSHIGFNPPPLPGSGFPPEAPADSVEWCREQFVVSSWEVLLGPEGRPLDPSAPQLHRSRVPSDAPPGAVFACGGVGMPPLTIRIDPSKSDPVWIQLPQGRTSIAIFGAPFQLVLDDPPRVVAPNGVVLLDGEVLDPDRGKPGLAICPGGDVVDFEMMPIGMVPRP